MDGPDILLVFRNPDTLDRIRRLLAGRAFRVTDAALSGGQALRIAGSRTIDIALVGADLRDMPLSDLCQELHDRCGCDVLLLGEPPGGAGSPFPGPESGIVRVPRPVTPASLLSALEAASAFRQRLKYLDGEVRRVRETLERRVVAEKAKGRLMAVLGLSEPDAWRRMQKQSMDTGRPLTEVARDILGRYGDDGAPDRPVPSGGS